jgi:hypothetical protein
LSKIDNLHATREKIKARQHCNIFVGVIAAILSIIGLLLYSYFQINAERNRALGNQVAAVL